MARQLVMTVINYRVLNPHLQTNKGRSRNNMQAQVCYTVRTQRYRGSKQDQVLFVQYEDRQLSPLLTPRRNRNYIPDIHYLRQRKGLGPCGE